MPTSLGDAKRFVKSPIRSRERISGIAWPYMPARHARFPVDALWRRHVRDWLAQQAKSPDGMSLSDLARFAKISPATLSGLLAGRYGHSHAVPLLNKMVGLPTPLTALGTMDESSVSTQIDAALASIDDDHLRGAFEAQLKAMLAAMRAASKPGSGENDS